MLAVCAALLFFVYWTFVLDPVLSSITSSRNDIRQLRVQIDSFMALKKAGLGTKNKKISLYPKEEQLALIVGFLESQMRNNNIKMLLLKQAAADNMISIDLEMEGSYVNLTALFESMNTLDTAFYVDDVSMTNQSRNILAKVRILTPFL